MSITNSKTIIVFFFSWEIILQHAANLASRTVSPLDPQALCTWGGANSTTKHLAKTIIVKSIKGTLILETKWKVKVMFGNSFYFLFSKKKIWEYKEKTIFLYFWNQKHVWLVKIKKIVFWRKKIENTKICCN